MELPMAGRGIRADLDPPDDEEEHLRRIVALVEQVRVPPVPADVRHAPRASRSSRSRPPRTAGCPPSARRARAEGPLVAIAAKRSHRRASRASPETQRDPAEDPGPLAKRDQRGLLDLLLHLLLRDSSSPASLPPCRLLRRSLRGAAFGVDLLVRHSDSPPRSRSLGLRTWPNRPAAIGHRVARRVCRVITSAPVTASPLRSDARHTSSSSSGRARGSGRGVQAPQ